MSQAARLQQRQRFFNLVVTNVPGPQQPLYLLGRRLRALYPVVPLAGRQALGVAVMSYDGRLGFGLLGDYDALADLDVLADDAERRDRRARRRRLDPQARGARPRKATRTAAAARRPPRGARADGRQGAAHARHDRADARPRRGGARCSSSRATSRRCRTTPAAGPAWRARAPWRAEPKVKAGNVVLLHSDERLTAGAARPRAGGSPARATRRSSPPARRSSSSSSPT